MEGATMRLQNGETLTMEMRPERAVLKIWLFTKCIPAAFIGGFLVFWAITFFGTILSPGSDIAPSETVYIHPTVPVAILLAGLAVIVIFIAALIYISFLQKTYVYTLTSKRVNFQGGILRYRDRSVNYDKIHNVEKSQNFFERMIWLESIWVHTAGYSGPKKKAEIVFEGLRDVGDALAEINKMKQSQSLKN